MNLQELHQQIIYKNLDNLYIFLGDEIAVQKIYINKIKELTGLDLQYIEDLKSIYNKLSSNNIFSAKKLYVVIDDIDFTKQEKLWEELQTKIKDNILILKYNTLDKRSKFYKHFTNRLVEFNKLSNELLIQYIQKDFPTMYKENCQKLIEICNSNYNQILLELDKLKQYNEIYEKDSYSKINNIFIDLDEHNLFHKEISNITFDFIDRVLKRDIKYIYKLRQQLKQIEESNLKLLSLLYTNFKTILLIQSCKSNDICKTTGLQYYQVKYNQDKINYYTISELVYNLKLIQSTEEKIKSGLIDEQISLDYVLANIL